MSAYRPSHLWQDGICLSTVPVRWGYWGTDVAIACDQKQPGLSLVAACQSVGNWFT